MSSVVQSDTLDNSATNVMTEQLTTFQEDRTVVETEYPKAISTMKNVSHILEARKHNIVDVLSRPHQIDTLEWNVTNNRPTAFTFSQAEFNIGTVSGLLRDYRFPETLYTSNIVSKLSNFLYLKANIEITVRVNANPFQQGKLWLTFSPYSSPDEIGKARNLLNEHRRAISNFPGVEIDVGSGNEGTIVIPYCSPLKAYPLVAPQNGDMGFVRLYVLNELADGTDAPAANITVYARFIDVSVEIPTISNPSALMSITNRLAFYKDLLYLIDVDFEKFLDILPNNDKLIYAQGDTGEVEATSKGIVSSLADTVAAVSGVAEGFPVIGDFAKTISWVAKFSSHVASYFGWSKPTSIENTRGYFNYPAKNYTHFEGVDNSVILSAIPDNQLDNTCKLFCTDCDEMSFDYILTRPTLERTFEWTTTNVSGDVLDALPCAFEHHYEDVIIDANQQAKADFSGIQRYIMNGFTQWNGDINIKLSCVKTGYHSGRIQVVFTPFTSSAPSVDLRGDCYSQVFDLRDSNEFCMRIPFTSPTNYLACDTEVFTGTGPVNNPATTFGVVHVIVINPLITNDNCSPAVQFNAWYSFAPGVELSCPTERRFLPFSMESSATAVSVSAEKAIFAQGGNDTSESFSNMSSQYIPMMNVNESSMSNSTECVGEKINNLRMMLRRFTLHTFVNGNGNKTLSKVRYGFKPAYRPATGGVANENNRRITDNVEYFSWIYRFVRGSERFKFFDLGQESSAGVQGAYVTGPRSRYSDSNDTNSPNGLSEEFRVGHINSSGVFKATPPIDSSVLSSAPSTFLSNALNNVLEVVLPSYSNVNKQVVGGTFTAETLTAYPFLTWWTSASTTNMGILRAMGDDASFGWMVGPPVTIDMSTISTISESVDFDLSNATSISQNPTNGYVVRLPVSGVTSNNTILASEGFETDYSTEDGRTSLNGGFLSIDVAFSNAKLYLTELGTPLGIYSPSGTLINLKNVGDVDVVLTPGVADNVNLSAVNFSLNNNTDPDFPSSFYAYKIENVSNESIPVGKYTASGFDRRSFVVAYSGFNGLSSFQNIGFHKPTAIGTSIIYVRELNTPNGTLDATSTASAVKAFEFNTLSLTPI